MIHASPRRLALAGLVSLAVANGIGRFVFTPILPPMMEALGLSAGQAGLIASANYAGYLAGALLGATAWLRGSPKAWLVGGLIASALTTAMVGLGSDVWTLSAVRFAGGLASAFVMVFGSTVVLERLSAAGRGGLSGVHFAGVGIGVALSAVLVWLVSRSGGDWRTMWFAAGAVSLIGALGAALMLRGPSPAGQAPAEGGAGKEPVSLLIAYGLLGFGYVITATFIVAIVRASPAARGAEPVVWLLVGLAAAPSTSAWTWVAGRMGELRAYALCCAIEAVGVALSVLAPNTAGAIAAALLLGGTYMGATALGLTAARHLAAHPRQALARMTASFGVGQMVGPLFAGVVAEHAGGFLIPSLTAALGLVVAAVLTFKSPSPLAGEGLG
ncbi:MAG: YbfB/YjiJ family MFS transporter [Parcubacteria group bacterium]